MQFSKETLYPSEIKGQLLENDPSLQNEWRLAFLLMCQFSPSAADLHLIENVSPLQLFREHWGTYVDEIEYEAKGKTRVSVIQEMVDNYGKTLLQSCENTFMSPLVYKWVLLAKMKGIAESLRIMAQQIIDFEYDSTNKRHHVYACGPTSVFTEQDDTIKMFNYILLYNKLPWIVASKEVVMKNSISKKNISSNCLKALAIALIHVVQSFSLVPDPKDTLIDLITPFRANPYLSPKTKITLKNDNQRETFYPEDILFGLNIAKFMPMSYEADRKEEAKRVFDLLIGNAFEFDELKRLLTYQKSSVYEDVFSQKLFVFDFEEMNYSAKEKYQRLMPILNVFASSTNNVTCKSYVISLITGSEIVSIMALNIHTIEDFFTVFEFASDRVTASAADVFLVDMLIKNFMKDWQDMNLLFIVHRVCVPAFKGKKIDDSTIVTHVPVQTSTTSNQLILTDNESESNATEENLYELYKQLFLQLTNKSNKPSTTFDDLVLV